MYLMPSFPKRSNRRILVILGTLFAPLTAFAQGSAVGNLKTLGSNANFAGQTDPRIIVGSIINSALGLVGVALVGFMVYAGFTWMTAGGESDKIEHAKTTIKNCIIGLAIILMAYAIANFVINALK